MSDSFSADPEIPHVIEIYLVSETPHVERQHLLLNETRSFSVFAHCQTTQVIFIAHEDLRYILDRRISLNLHNFNESKASDERTHLVCV